MATKIERWLTSWKKGDMKGGLSLKYECMYISVFFHLPTDVCQLDPGVASTAGLWHHLLWLGNTRCPEGCSEQLYISYGPSLLPEADKPVAKEVFYLFIFLFSFISLYFPNLSALYCWNLKIYSVLYIFHACVWILCECVCSYGMRATGQVRWKHFLGHFMSPGKEEGDKKLHTDRSVR